MGLARQTLDADDLPKNSLPGSVGLYGLKWHREALISSEAGATIQSRALSNLIEAGAVAGIHLLENVAHTLDGDVMRGCVDVLVGIDLVRLRGRLGR